jgi:acyl-CoA synthetase (AMP-forming)/AMP-acid ligase II
MPRTGSSARGDLASAQIIDGQRCISIDGRIKDLINRGGEKINAEEVELLLVDHPASSKPPSSPCPTCNWVSAPAPSSSQPVPS